MPLELPKGEVTVSVSCGVCRAPLDSYEVKLDNLMLLSSEEVWCPECQASQPEVREVAGRRAAVEKETAAYPKNLPANPTPPPWPVQSSGQSR